MSKYIAIFFVLVHSLDGAVVAWSSITTSIVNGAPTSEVYGGTTYNFDGQDEVVDTFMAGGELYTPLIGYNLSDFTIKSNPDNTRVWYERSSVSGNNYRGGALSDLNDMFSVPLRINYGHDDTFVKSLDSITFSSTQGIQVTDAGSLDNVGISILERGANDNGFRVRLVTGVDSVGDALSYSDWYNIGGGDPFGSGIQNVNHDLWDSNNTDTTGAFSNPDQANRNQSIGGVVITYDLFNITTSDVVYGYEIQDDPDRSGTPGLDLLSGAASVTDSNATGVIVIVPEPSTILLSLVGMLAVLGKRNRE